MNAACSLGSFLLVSLAPLLAPEPIPRKLPILVVEPVAGAVYFHVDFADTPFVAVVVASLSDSCTHYLVGLPPLLDQPVVLGWGGTKEERFSLKMQESVFPAGVPVFAQGLTLSEAGLLASEVGAFVTGPSHLIVH